MGRILPAGNVDRRSVTWLRTHKLAIGPMPQTRADWSQLQHRGVRSIFSCCHPDEGPWHPPPEWRQLCFTLPDHRHPEAMTRELLEAALNAALEIYREDPPLYLHCWAGMERSPLLAVGLLCRTENLELFDALAQVRSAHPIARPLIAHLLILESILTG